MLLLGTALLGACAGQARDVDSEDYIERLEVQLDYLMSEIEGIDGGWSTRRDVLYEFYTQRLRTFELLKLDVETELRLGS